jgi:hypothetical protein
MQEGYEKWARRIYTTAGANKMIFCMQTVIRAIRNKLTASVDAKGKYIFMYWWHSYKSAKGGYDLSYEFQQKVINYSEKLGINPIHLMKIMAAESGLDPAAKNPNSGAVGLIQFLKPAAKTVGTTVAALQNMTREKQIDYVYKYFDVVKKTAKIKYNNIADLYVSTWLPYEGAQGKPDSYVIASKDDKKTKTYYTQNPILDENKDGKITMKDLKDHAEKWSKSYR